MLKKTNKLRLMDSPVYHYWNALYLSFFSKRLYLDVVKRWNGYGFLYLLFVVSLLSIPFSLRIIDGFNHYFKDEITYPISKLPLLYIQNGQVVFDEPMPYLIKNKKGEVIDIIDTTGKVKEITNDQKNLILLITKDKIYSRFPMLDLFFGQDESGKAGEITVTTLDSKMNEIFNPQDWIKSGRLQHFKWFIEMMIYPVMTMIFYGMFLVIMVVFGYTAIIFAQVILKYKLKFKAGIRLFIVTSTPQMMLFYIVYTSGYTFKGIGLVQLLLLAIYFNYAVLCIKHDSKKLVNT